MSEDIEQMRKRHKEEIGALQENCPHKSTTRMSFMWAIGHYGNDVEVCNYCGKIVEHYDDRRTK